MAISRNTTVASKPSDRFSTITPIAAMVMQRPAMMSSVFNKLFISLNMINLLFYLIMITANLCFPNIIAASGVSKATSSVFPAMADPLSSQMRTPNPSM